MRILIAPDSYKNALSALEVAKSLKSGLQKVFQDAEFEILPMADGGEGTVEALIDATQGQMIKTPVCDPLMRPIESSFGITGDGVTAVIEMASASGIQLITSGERNPWITTTYGTGELILAALDRGCRDIILGIGGSATNDCGMGMAAALGVKFLDHAGNSVGPGGGMLAEVTRIDISGLDNRIKETKIMVACDVTNPLTGPDGAAHVYGPQQGADPEMVNKLDSNLKKFSDLIMEQLGKDVEQIPGAGAAGGLGAGLIAFLDGELVEGVPAIAAKTGLDEAVAKADIVITGEGGIDFQTQFGKTPYGVAQVAKKHGKPVIAVAGTIGKGVDELYSKGIDAVISILDRPLSLEEAIEETPSLLEATGERIGRLLILGRSL
ncbi:MAG: glycerate kinase [Bacteroidales bacterium]